MDHSDMNDLSETDRLNRSKFWAIKLDPDYSYVDTVTNPFHICRASIEKKRPNRGPSRLLYITDNDFLRLGCTLSPADGIYRQALNQTFHRGERIEYGVYGPDPITVTGYYLPEDRKQKKRAAHSHDDEPVRKKQSKDPHAIDWDLVTEWRIAKKTHLVNPSTDGMPSSSKKRPAEDYAEEERSSKKPKPYQAEASGSGSSSNSGNTSNRNCEPQHPKSTEGLESGPSANKSAMTGGSCAASGSTEPIAGNSNVKKNNAAERITNRRISARRAYEILKDTGMDGEYYVQIISYKKHPTNVLKENEAAGGKKNASAKKNQDKENIDEKNHSEN